MELQDRLQRPLRDLRISVTDRCNFRCRYCMPREVFGPDYTFLDRKEILTYEELARLARLFTSLGVEKIRITGGEPLVRRDLPRLVAMLSDIDGVGDLCLTTNGALLPKFARTLKDAGLGRVTVSLDSLDEEVFGRMNDAGISVRDVLAGIESAREAGLSPVKVNAVIQKGLNDHTLVDLARGFRGSGTVVRFIEYMDVGNSNGWKLDHVVPAAEIIRRIHAEMPLETMEPNYPGEVSRRFRYVDGKGEIGVITSVSNPFCGSCTRARLAPDGKLYTCLFAAEGHDLRGPLRSGADDGEILETLRSIWKSRGDRYSELRSEATSRLPKVEMSFIGG